VRFEQGAGTKIAESSCENIARAKESKVHHATLGLQEKNTLSALFLKKPRLLNMLAFAAGAPARAADMRAVAERKPAGQALGGLYAERFFHASLHMLKMAVNILLGNMQGLREAPCGPLPGAQKFDDLFSDGHTKPSAGY
jgi:hypothetical protein